MTDQKHIEAAAAAYDKEGGMHVGAASIHRLRAAITAYHASLAAEGEDGLVEAMLQAYQWPTITPPNRATKGAMRAALGVVLGAMEARRNQDTTRLDKLQEIFIKGTDAHIVMCEDDGDECDAESHPHFECFSWDWRCKPVRGNTLRAVIDAAIDAARAQEGDAKCE